MRNITPPKILRALTIASFLLGSLILISHVWFMNASCPDYAERISGAPEYIATVWPLPNSEIEFRCYMKKELRSFMSIEGNVTIAMIPIKSFKSQEVDYQEAHPNEVFAPFEKRVALYVDEKKVKTGVQIAGSDSLPTGGDRFPNELQYLYVFKSYPLLFPGAHKAKVVLALKNGEVFDYEWRFKIK